MNDYITRVQEKTYIFIFLDQIKSSREFPTGFNIHHPPCCSTVALSYKISWALSFQKNGGKASVVFSALQLPPSFLSASTVAISG